MLNIHTHHIPSDASERYILSCYPDAVPDARIMDDSRLFGVSVGLHPWHVDATWREKCDRVGQEARSTAVRMIGECGLDRASASDYGLQLQAFERQLQVAEAIGKPVLVHCVRAWDDLLRMRTIYNKVAWVVHGFRGKPELLRQLYAKGIWVSFGTNYNEKALRLLLTESLCSLDLLDSLVSLDSLDSLDQLASLAPFNPFFLETDDRPEASLRMVCLKACQSLGVDPHEVQRRVDLSEALLFGRHA